MEQAIADKIRRRCRPHDAETTRDIPPEMIEWLDWAIESRMSRLGVDDVEAGRCTIEQLGGICAIRAKEIGLRRRMRRIKATAAERVTDAAEALTDLAGRFARRLPPADRRTFYRQISAMLPKPPPLAGPASPAGLDPTDDTPGDVEGGPC